MGKILIGTTHVLADEPCLGLAELNKQSPDSRGFHRYQFISVIRNDKRVDYREDLGLASDYKADQFVIPGGVENERGGVIVETVGRLKDIAEQVRNTKLWDKRELVKRNNIKE